MAPTGNLYGHLLRDPKADCLLIRPLSQGLSCQTQLVYNYTTRSTCVRKCLRHPLSPGGQDPAVNDAVDEFDRDARVAGALHAASTAAAADKDGSHLRVPRLLSAASAPDGSRVSYWGLCNGGTVRSLLERCADTDSVLPMGLALHILLQTLETLDFMYSGLDTPLFHSDLHDHNLMLHFAPGAPIPDVHVIDFGRAVHCPPREGDYLAHQAASKRALPHWDVPFVLRMV
ncbi:hypothetical protein C8A01DRAFT_14921, partial [Parachaetomium inaequale]